MSFFKIEEDEVLLMLRILRMTAAAFIISEIRP